MYRKISAVIISTLFAFGIIIYMLWRVWDDLIVALQHIIPGYLILAIIPCLLAWILRGQRYRSILSSLNQDHLAYSTLHICDQCKPHRMPAWGFRTGRYLSKKWCHVFRGHFITRVEVFTILFLLPFRALSIRFIEFPHGFTRLLSVRLHRRHLFRIPCFCGKIYF
jgi:hypothetical protein